MLVRSSDLWRSKSIYCKKNLYWFQHAHTHTQEREKDLHKFRGVSIIFHSNNKQRERKRGKRRKILNNQATIFNVDRRSVFDFRNYRFDSIWVDSINIVRRQRHQPTEPQAKSDRTGKSPRIFYAYKFKWGVNAEWHFLISSKTLARDLWSFITFLVNERGARCDITPNSFQMHKFGSRVRSFYRF